MDTDRISTWITDFGMRTVVKHRRLFLLGVLLFVAVTGLGMNGLVLDSSNESFFSENDEIIKKNDRFKEIFGNEEFVFILVEGEQIFSTEVLAYIRALTNDLKENLPFVNEIMSLADIEYVKAEDGVLEVGDLLGADIPTDRRGLEEIKRKALSKEIYIDRIISRDGTKTGIFITFDPIPETVYVPAGKTISPLALTSRSLRHVVMADDIYREPEPQGEAERPLIDVPDPRKLISPALTAIVGRHDSGPCRISMTGIPMLDFELDRLSAIEGIRFGAIALVCSGILLIALFRSFTGVTAPVFVIVSSLVILYGMMGWLNVPLTMTSMIIATLMLVISVSYSIHFINHFLYSFQKTGDREASVRYCLAQAVWPCFVTAATTAMGFASFVVVPMKPIRDVGVTCAAGVFITYVMVATLIPVLFSFGKDGAADTAGARDLNTAAGWSGRFLRRWADWVLLHVRPLVVVLGVLIAGIVYYAPKMRVESDFIEALGDKIKIVRDSRHISENLGGLYSYEVLLEFPSAGMTKEPGVLRNVDALAETVQAWDSTSLTTCITDVIKDIHRSLNDDDRSFYSIPDSPEAVSQLLLLYEMSGGEGMDEWLSPEGGHLRLSVHVRNSSSTLQEKFADIESFVHRRFPAGTEVTIVGDVPMMMRMVSMLTEGQIRSILAAFVGIAVMMMLVLRSLGVGCISMIPNVLPVGILCALMGISGIPLDITTIMIAPMILGIAVDDTVHFFIHFKNEYKRTGAFAEANRLAFQKVGKAILFTSLVLSVGFGIFALSELKSMVHFAILSVVGILSALVADLVFSPVLLLLLSPFGRRPEKSIVKIGHAPLALENVLKAKNKG